MIRKEKVENISKLFAQRRDKVDKINQIFAKAIGKKNFLTKERVFTEFYGKESKNWSELERYSRWLSLKGLIQRYRKRTKFFIIPKFSKLHHDYVFFVAKSRGDTSEFRKFLTAIRDGLDMAIDRCERITSARKPKLEELYSQKKKGEGGKYGNN